jgi:hypothetical protein
MQRETPSASAQTESIPQTQPQTQQTQARPHHLTRALFHHEPRQYQPRNANVLLKAEQAAAGINTRLAVGLTKGVGTMWTAYSFAVLAIIGLLAILNLLNPLVALLVAWASQTFLQLVFLPIILVGQNVLGRKAELQAEEQFRTTTSAYHDIEEIMKHLQAQDAELLRHAHMLMHLLEKNGISLQQLEAEGVTTTHLVDPFTQPQATVNAPAAPAPIEDEKQNG